MARYRLKFSSLVIGFGVLLAGILFAFLFFRKSTYINVVIKVGEPNYVYQVWRNDPYNGDVFNWFSQLLKPGMEEHDGLGKNVATVLNIFRYDSSPNTSNVYLTVKIKTTYSRGSGQYTFKGKPVLVGSEIQLYLNQLLVNGTITDVLDENLKQTLYKVTVHASLFPNTFSSGEYLNTSGVPPFLANAVKKGEAVYDNQQRPLIQVIDKQVFDAQTAVFTADGRLITQANPLLKDVTFTLELLATKVGDKYYLLGDIPIVIGRSIPTHTKTASIYPIIIDIMGVK